MAETASEASPTQWSWGGLGGHSQPPPPVRKGGGGGGGGGLGSQTLLDWLKIGPNPVEKSYIYIFENIPERERGEATLEH